MMQGRLFYDIDSVRVAFQDELKKGQQSDCPCCGRHAQIYRRKFHSSMAFQLIRLYRMGGHQRWIHTSRLILPGMAGSGDFSKSKYWGLACPKDKANHDIDAAGKATGFWRITPEGEGFINGNLVIPREVMVFDDSVLGRSRETISIREALGSKFNYDELMGARF